MRLSEMFFLLLVRLEKGLNLREAISYEKSVGAYFCVYQKCPFRCRYDRYDGEGGEGVGRRRQDFTYHSAEYPINCCHYTSTSSQNRAPSAF